MSAWIEGSATSTIVASRTTMKKAPQRSASAHQRRGSGVFNTSPSARVEELGDLDSEPVPQTRTALGQLDRGVDVIGGDQRVAALQGLGRAVPERAALDKRLARVYE